jgi:predicted permease
MIPVLEVFGFVAIPVCQTVFTAMLGALIAHPRLCGLSNEDKMALCKMYAYVFFPCFLVDKLVHGLSAGRFVEWWPLLASLAANTFMGVGLGYVTAVFLQRVGYLSRSGKPASSPLVRHAKSPNVAEQQSAG